jgi:hypothetical protein
MTFVWLVNSRSWRHDWKEHVFHKAFQLLLSKLRESEQIWQLSGVELLQSVQAGYMGLCKGGRRGGNLVTSLHGVPSALQDILSTWHTWVM